MSTENQTLPYDQADAERKLAPWWGRIQREASYPADSGTVVELLRGVEYDVTHDDLLAYLTAGIIGPVVRENGRLAWSPLDILGLAFALENRRKWQPLSELHRHKASLGEYMVWMAQAAGGKAFRDLADHDMDSILALIVRMAGDPSAVSVLVEAVREKLRQGEGIA